MKRLFAFMMALVLVLSLGVTATATVTENNGAITITNATKDETYKLYHIFDASYSTKTDGTADSVIYSINKDTNPFFAYLFGADGTTENPHFTYDAEKGTVAKRATTSDQAIIDYLTEMVRTKNEDKTDKFSPEATKIATDKIVTFDNLPYGYYLIDKGAGSAVTIDSNTPTVEVIDKNQKPGNGFDKLLWVKDPNGSVTRGEEKGNWVNSNTASVGDIVEWKVEYTATNYDGDDIVLYYAITDEKSSPLWVEFNQIQVFVGGKELTKGYYYCANHGIETNEWQYFGTGWGTPEQVAALPKDDSKINEAQWYLVHYTYDRFEIVIPWLDDHTFTGVQDANQGFKLEFDLDKADGNDIYSESKFSSPAKVEVLYKASVGPGAAGTTARNDAYLEWTTPEGDTGPETPETTETKVYNMGVTKVANDGTSEHAATRLAGAVFELYKDADCTLPIYVIPTNNTGVYILDDVDTNVSGYNRVTSREMYVGHWENYINGTAEDPNPNGSGNKRQDMVTPDNGQLVIMGLEAGTYYLKETKAPVGYNELPAVVEVKVGPEGTAGTYSDPSYKDLKGNSIQYTVSKIEVVNSKGIELPSTGGEGTMMLITFGSIVAMAFAVLLITHKKMSIYHD